MNAYERGASLQATRRSHSSCYLLLLGQCSFDRVPINCLGRLLFSFCRVLLAFLAMDSSNLPLPPQESTDIFSLSDQVLSDRLQFIEEAGLVLCSKPIN